MDIDPGVSRVPGMRRLLLPLAAVAALAAGCGGASKSVAGGVSGASIVPASAPVYIALDSDLSSSQAKQADELLKKFPGRDRLLAELRKSLASEGVDLDKLKNAVGPEVDIVLLRLGNDPSPIGLTQPKNEHDFDQLLETGDEPLKHERIGDWTAFSDEQAALDQLKAAQGDNKLADKDSFAEAMDALPSDALAKAYVDGPGVSQALTQALQGQSVGSLGTEKLKWASAALEAQNDGASLKVVANGLGTGGSDFEPSLLDKAPAGALVFATFKGVGSSLRQAGLGSVNGIIEPFLGVKLDDIAALLEGEGAVWASAGTPFPEVTVVLSGDPQRSLATLDTLAGRIATFASTSPPKPTTIAGVPMKELSLGPVSILYGIVGEKVLLTDSASAVRDFQIGPAKSLADDESFKSAKDAAGMPDSTAGFLYVNVPDAYATISGFAKLAGETVPPEVDANVRPLRSFLFWGAHDGAKTELQAFLEIR